MSHQPRVIVPTSLDSEAENESQEEQQEQQTGQLVLEDIGSDGITRVCYGKQEHILSGGWDKTANMHDAQTGKCLVRVDCHAPLLNCSFTTDDDHVIATLADGNVCAVQMAARQTNVLGSHGEAGVRGLCYDRDRQVVMTGAWDGTLKLWDVRQADPLVTTVSLDDGKVQSMDCTGDGKHLVVGTSGKSAVYIYDLRQFRNCLQKRQSPFAEQLRVVRCNPFVEGQFLVSSVSSRIGVNYVVEDDKKNHIRYAFKSHRVHEERLNTRTSHPVHALEFNPSTQHLASGGGDGKVIFWNIMNRKKVEDFCGFKNTVASMAFAPDGERLCIALSYAYEHGEIPHKKDSIVIRKVNTAT